MDINFIKKLRCYRNTNPVVLENVSRRISNAEKIKKLGLQPVQRENEVLTHIFAPDPKSGLPKSDIAYILSQDSSPEIAQYILNNIMRPLHVAISGASNPDDAIAAVRQVGESFEAFADRLKETFDTPIADEDNEEVE